jgi:hypothetical protein
MNPGFLAFFKAVMPGPAASVAGLPGGPLGGPLGGCSGAKVLTVTRGSSREFAAK